MQWPAILIQERMHQIN